MTPEPGAQVRVTFIGVTESTYRSGAHPDGALVEMLPVRLDSGRLVFVPLVDEVDVTPEAAGG